MPFPPDESASIRPWLVAPRLAGATPKLIIVHATRGANTQAAQYGATKNWFNSEGNRGRNGDGSLADWGGSAHVVISHEGQLCQFFDDSETAHYGAGFGSKLPPYGWSADDWGLSMELAQSDKQEAFAAATIERAAMQAASWCRRFDIAPVHLGRIDQGGAGPTLSGIVGHDETENGRKLGKTDPGARFPWEEFMSQVVGYLDGRRAGESNPQESAGPAGGFRRHNGGFVDLTLPLADGVLDAREAFNLPAQARRLQLQVWLQEATPEARIYDGTPDAHNREAGRAYAPYGIVGPVILGEQGEIFLTLPEGLAAGSVRVASLGFWE